MKKLLKFLVVIILPLAPACTEQHLLPDPGYSQLVDSLFNARKELCKNKEKELFSLFDNPMPLRRREAMKFLYAFMPLNDLADYTGRFFLANVDTTLETCDKTAWGRDIPADIFLHYILPIRVNNENLDSFRLVYSGEIRNRIKGKNIVEAALEINHWCHEKVVYQPSDIRTSAPMSTILSARGRCGEESTFTVAALRAAGIPARQVYTPRWAHTDDNHAWVEVWSGGKWYYMGACEPEPVLDLGWFTEPARRAMLIHTKSFGASTGGENAINIHKYFTEVNELSKYAVTKKIRVRVTDRSGMPVKNARVEYQLYNYAEFYPLAIVPTDQKGISSFETGLGDLLVWASDSDYFSYRKISVALTDTLDLVLDRKTGETYSIDLDLDVPVELKPLPGPPAEMIAANQARLESEDKIRQKYIDSWIKPDEARDFAIAIGADTELVKKALARSMGNYREIKSFLSGIPDSLKDIALTLLDLLPDKDLRDTRAAVLYDHLINASSGIPQSELRTDLYREYVLNPRIANELLSPWRSFLPDNLPGVLVRNAHSDPSLIADFLNSNILIDNEANYYNTPITPAGVIRLRASDSFSRDICFVAICRSLGIPARLEPGSNVPQYFQNSVWHGVYFPDRGRLPEGKGYVRLVSSSSDPVPEYYTQFTLARFDNGRYNTLEYDYNKKISEFRDELALTPGSYMLVTGNRLPDGKVLSSLSFFELREGEHKKVNVKIRHDNGEKRIPGSIDIKAVTSLFEGSGINPDKLAGKGMALMWIDPGKEPTRHIFNDLPRLRDEFDSWGGYIIFLTDPSVKWEGFKGDEAKEMPSNIIYAHDNRILLSVTDVLGIKEVRMPLVILADHEGNILYSSEGYRIGTGEELLKKIR